MSESLDLQRPAVKYLTACIADYRSHECIVIGGQRTAGIAVNQILQQHVMGASGVDMDLGVDLKSRLKWT